MVFEVGGTIKWPGSRELIIRKFDYYIDRAIVRYTSGGFDYYHTSAAEIARGHGTYTPPTKLARALYASV